MFNLVAALGDPKIIESLFLRAMARGVEGLLIWCCEGDFPVNKSIAIRPFEGVRLGVPDIPVESGDRVISASSGGTKGFKGEL